MTAQTSINSETHPDYTVENTVVDPWGFTEAELHTIEKAKEIMQRAFNNRSDNQLTSSQLTKDYLRLLHAQSDYEMFGMIVLDQRHQVIGNVELSTGTIDSASVYPREVVKAVINNQAAAVVFYHNHPSGRPNPSEGDDRITAKLRQALASIDVRVLDHIIVGMGGTYSYAEYGKI